ncbi:hypothetical protein FEF33_03420 [Moraxella osloensis]|jgi:hypothetical protein|nr:hypothetical protein FEF33_03420 [Moraxella osloensis]
MIPHRIATPLLRKFFQSFCQMDISQAIQVPQDHSHLCVFHDVDIGCFEVSKVANDAICFKHLGSDLSYQVQNTQVDGRDEVVLLLADERQNSTVIFNSQLLKEEDNHDDILQCYSQMREQICAI